MGKLAKVEIIDLLLEPRIREFMSLTKNWISVSDLVENHNLAQTTTYHVIDDLCNAKYLDMKKNPENPREFLFRSVSYKMIIVNGEIEKFE